jgi:hypothetical protein
MKKLTLAICSVAVLGVGVLVATNDDGRSVLAVCPGDPPSVVEAAKEKDLPSRECRVVARSKKFETSTVEDDVTAQLREACQPCGVSGDSWGVCPRCILGEKDKTDCATLCKVTAEPK